MRFSDDLNGIIEVESTIVGTDTSTALVIERRPGAMSAKELTAAREAMKRLKFHPRDALPNRTALARGEALYAELAGPDRVELGAAIAQLLAALETQDQQLVVPAREVLVSMISRLGRGRD